MVGGHTSADAQPKPIGSCMRKIKSAGSWWYFLYDKYNGKSIDFTFLQPKVLFIIQFNCQNLTPITRPTCSLALKLQKDIKRKIDFIVTFFYENLWKTLLLMCFSKKLCQMKYGNSKYVSMFTSISVF